MCARHCKFLNGILKLRLITFPKTVVWPVLTAMILIPLDLVRIASSHVASGLSDTPSVINTRTRVAFARCPTENISSRVTLIAVATTPRRLHHLIHRKTEHFIALLFC